MNKSSQRHRISFATGCAQQLPVNEAIAIKQEKQGNTLQALANFFQYRSVASAPASRWIDTPFGGAELWGRKKKKGAESGEGERAFFYYSFAH